VTERTLSRLSGDADTTSRDVFGRPLADDVDAEIASDPSTSRDVFGRPLADDVDADIASEPTTTRDVFSRPLSTEQPAGIFGIKVSSREIPGTNQQVGGAVVPGRLTRRADADEDTPEGSRTERQGGRDRDPDTESFTRERAATETSEALSQARRRADEPTPASPTFGVDRQTGSEPGAGRSRVFEESFGRSSATRGGRSTGGFGASRGSSQSQSGAESRFSSLSGSSQSGFGETLDSLGSGFSSSGRSTPGSSDLFSEGSSSGSGFESSGSSSGPGRSQSTPSSGGSSTPGRGIPGQGTATPPRTPDLGFDLNDIEYRTNVEYVSNFNFLSSRIQSGNEVAEDVNSQASGGDIVRDFGFGDAEEQFGGDFGFSDAEEQFGGGFGFDDADGGPLL
jgi:hypothetical protein